MGFLEFRRQGLKGGLKCLVDKDMWFSGGLAENNERGSQKD